MSGVQGVVQAMNLAEDKGYTGVTEHLAAAATRLSQLNTPPESETNSIRGSPEV